MIRSSIVVVFTVFYCLISLAALHAQEASPAEAAPTPEPPPALADPTESVQVDWLEEMLEGGVTMIALGLLSVALVAISVERLWFLRRRRFLPPDLFSRVNGMVRQYQYDAAAQACARSNTPLGDGLEILIERRRTNPDAAFTLAGDVMLRRMEAEERRGAPLAVIAGLAPLLGLLGTMIGMIEAFKLVEVFGDEGGASLLAGSISKALITTAAGLVIAVPSLIAFHIAKYKIGLISDDLELALEKAQGQWFLSDEAPLLAEFRVEPEPPTGAEAPYHPVEPN